MSLAANLSSNTVARVHEDIVGQPTLRRRAGAAAMVLVFPCLIGATLTDPVNQRASRATQAHQGLANLSAMTVTAALELAAAFFALCLVVTMLGAIRHRGAGLANAGAVLGLFGTIGMALIPAHRIFMIGLVQADPDHAAKVLAAVDRQSLAAVVVPLFFLTPLAVTVFAAAAWRAGLVQWPNFGLAVLFLVTEIVPSGGGMIVSLVLGLACYGWIASVLISGPRDRPTD
jgi:hypothetical protein